MHYDGLSNNKVIRLRQKFGENRLPSKESSNAFKTFIKQFQSPLIYLLIATGSISFLLGDINDAFLIIAVLFINVIIGFYQENKAQKTLDSLKELLEPISVVIREGKRIKITTHEIVPEDLIVLGPGDIVPADGEIIESVNLLIKESILTGESEAIEKSVKIDNKVYMGTTVIGGTGVIKANKTGINTKFGKIGLELVRIENTKTPLQIKLHDFSKKLTLLVIILAILFFIIGIIYGQPAFNTFKYSIILAISIIPEGLPIVVTVILARGMSRILKAKGLVKNLLGVETLGTTTVICTDKTGTLTTGNMEVVKGEFMYLNKMLEALIVNNEQRTNIELATYEYVKNSKYDIESFLDNYKKIYAEPFSSDNKYASSICECPNKYISYLTGAPEIILGFCNITKSHKGIILDQINKYSKEGYRLIGGVYKEGNDLKQMKLKSGYNWAGLIMITDPIRKNASLILDHANKAGIDVKILTGDYRDTAKIIAYQIGLNLKDEEILEGEDIERLSSVKLSKIINNIKLFARITPHHKLKIVEALQNNGEVVAMTGDGVNDVLALKKADIGIAMGNATEVTKEAADLILLDNNFNTIIKTVEEGRLVYRNIRKVIGYILSNSFLEITVILGAIIARLDTPLTVAQILWIHLICDGPPDIALSFDNDKKGLMNEKPKNAKNDFIIDSKVKYLIVFISIFTGLLGLLLFAHISINVNDYKLAQTFVFALLSIISLTYILSYKDLEMPVYKVRGLLKNKVLIYSVIYGYILTFIAIYVEPIRNALGTTILGLEHWIIIFLIALSTIIGIETIKYIKKT